ncbi:MAG: hypothetical protein CMH77_01370 [Nitrospinae bacterium]|nr:hypothetical protein [Nitrospinota bacterium]
MIRHRLFMAWVAALTLFGIASDARSLTEIPPREFLIVYSGNTLGELKPCGCAKEEDQGGFERRVTYFKQVAMKSKNTLFVDTGDSFKEPSRQGKIKARYLMQAMSLLKYDAVIPGDKDLVYGEAFLNEGASIPWLLSNARLSKINPPETRIKKLENGLTIAMLAVVDPDLYYAAEHNGGRITDPKESAKKSIDKLNASEHPDVIVLLTHMKRDKALSLLALDGVDVVINGHIEADTDVIDMTPVKQDGKIFIQPGPRGQKMGELTVRIDKAGNKSFDQRMVRLDSNIKFDPKMIKWYEDYNREVEDLFFASLDARKDQHGKEKVYASEQMCLTCHLGKHDVWSKSRHGHAYETINRVNKAFDPECLKCHVTGFDRAGGFISEVDTPDLKNVQCEVCHGPGLEHAEDPQPGFGSNAQQACKLCHVKNHSPNFNFSKYWPKIKH